jgi:hypothetical protein
VTTPLILGKEQDIGSTVLLYSGFLRRGKGRDASFLTMSIGYVMTLNVRARPNSCAIRAAFTLTFERFCRLDTNAVEGAAGVSACPSVETNGLC